MYPNQPQPPDQQPQPMYPEQQPTYAAPPNSNGKKLLLLIVLVILVVVVFVFQILASHRHQALPPAKPTSASATLIFDSQSDAQGASVLFNGSSDKSTGSGKQLTYVLKPGSYTLKVSKTGYQPFTANFVARTGEPVQVNVDLQPAAAPPSISSIGQISAGTGNRQSLASVLPPASVITQKTYFDNNTWAVLTFATHFGIGYAVVVAQFNPSTNSWMTVYGPDDDFEESALQSMPSDLQSYVNNNFYVESSN